MDAIIRSRKALAAATIATAMVLLSSLWAWAGRRSAPAGARATAPVPGAEVSEPVPKAATPARYDGPESPQLGEAPPLSSDVADFLQLD